MWEIGGLISLAINVILVLFVINLLGHKSDAKKRREHEQAKSEALLASLGEGIVVTDKDGNVELINHQAERLVGWTRDEVIGKKWYDIAPLEDEPGNRIPSEKRATQVVLKTGQARFNDTYYYVRKDGTRFAVGTTAAPVVLDGKPVGVIAVFRDISREKEIDRAKSEFVSLASHQLRTPLSAIKWFAEMLLEGDAGELSKEQKECVSSIALSNERMIELVGSLLNISRIESGRIIVEPQPCDLGQLVNSVLESLKIRFRDKKLEMEVQIEKDLPQINLDQRMISQVFQNLLTNAIKYTPEGGKVIVNLKRQGEEVVAQVSDTGFGIPKSEQYRLFQRFYRGSNVLKLETDGTGLGLYLVKAIIESSNGKIWFESMEGKGTSFWFSLPLVGVPAKSGEVTLS